MGRRIKKRSLRTMNPNFEKCNYIIRRGNQRRRCEHKAKHNGYCTQHAKMLKLIWGDD